MKRTRKRTNSAMVSDDLRPEYRFDYRKARPNRFAGRIGEAPAVAVVEAERILEVPEERRP